MNDPIQTSYRYTACVRRNTAPSDKAPNYEDFWFTFESYASHDGSYEGVVTGEMHHAILTALWKAFHADNPFPVGSQEWGPHLPELIEVHPLDDWHESNTVCCENCRGELNVDDAITYPAGFGKTLTFCSETCRNMWREQNEDKPKPLGPVLTPATGDEF